MSHAVAEYIARQAEGSALTIEEQIKSNLIAMESIRAAAMTLADSMCAVLADQNKALAKLAAAQRAGLGIMPPVTTQVLIDPESLVQEPLVPRRDAPEHEDEADIGESGPWVDPAEDVPTTLHAVEPVEATRTIPQPETLAA